MELVSEKYTLENLMDLRRNNMLTVNPEYQRGAVWNENQQKKLIDSVMRGYPLPLIYLHHKKKTVAGMSREDLEIIDGQQRINALYRFKESALKLFDPKKDDKIARFPAFIRDAPCLWSHKDYLGLSDELREKFDKTELFVVKITTENEDEARDLFIRLQAGIPLNAQEKRDAWPGGFTEFVLKFGGKSEITRYPGHDFFRKHISTSASDRGATRQLCAQIGMLFFEEASKGHWQDIGTQQIDDYYYRNLGFDTNSGGVSRFSKVLDTVVEIFDGYRGPKLKAHEAIHIILLVESLIDDYTKGWEDKFVSVFDSFREKAALDKKNRDGEYWFNYGLQTQTQSSNARTIQGRHKFFLEKMIPLLQLTIKDSTRAYGQVEREYIYYRDGKRCAVCKSEIKWENLEVHHINEHQHGGKTDLANGVSVHSECHPKGEKAKEFYEKWLNEQEQIIIEKI